MSKPPKESIFSRYEIFVIAILTFIQFTVILDFMVLSPLGAQLMKEMTITPKQFSLVVSAYAISAGISGLLAAGFADKFDRKKILLFFYVGFVIGTMLCGIAPSYEFLLVARIVTGIFGGVIGSICFAIVTDLFVMQHRGRVMGFLQMAFASSQVLGIPVGLKLADMFDWHFPFIMIVVLSVIVGFVIVVYLKPINKHLAIQSDRSAFQHFGHIVSQTRYLKGFAATIFLATGGFMLMPFGSAFAVHNLGIEQDKLYIIYAVTGIFSMITGPLIGKFADQFGKYPIFIAGTILSAVLVNIYCQLSVTPMWIVIALNTILFMGIMARMISSSALMTAVPDAKDRGAFMGINSSVQQISGGIAAAIAGFVVVQQNENAPLEQYDTLGYVVTCTMFVTMLMMYIINKQVNQQQKAQQQQPVAA